VNNLQKSGYFSGSAVLIVVTVLPDGFSGLATQRYPTGGTPQADSYPSLEENPEVQRAKSWKLKT